MINASDSIGVEERLNILLDKISNTGVRSLKKNEILFLDSYSIGKEDETNKKMLDEESNCTFLSDDGNFIFKLESVECADDIQYINGSIMVPDIILKNKRRIKGELKGSIIIFSDNHIAIDFHRGKYDIFEFVSGLEYELDCFVDDLILKIKNNN